MKRIVRRKEEWYVSDLIGYNCGFIMSFLVNNLQIFDNKFLSFILFMAVFIITYKVIHKVASFILKEKNREVGVGSVVICAFLVITAKSIMEAVI